ncbi:MAG: DUF1080 domain-containing protein, partial [Puniceicoccales bacterium]|nr:DUF1080 domain-containing protein [Puniceicoccales bacterium]
TPAYACNQVQFWHDFRADVVEKELAAARKFFAITTLRVYLHPINFEQDKENFFANLERFLVICAKHNIKPGFTFFDDCHRPDGIFLKTPTEPVKGWHNGRWAVAPQKRDRDINNLARYKPYFQEIIGKYKDDPRVLWWETFNEPNMKDKWSVAMRKAAYKWAKEAAPSQPILCCWDDSPETDIVNAHNYQNHVYRDARRAAGATGGAQWTYGAAGFGDWDKQVALNPKKGCVFTEAGARWFAPRTSNGEPVEVIRWLEFRKAQKQYVPGVYLCWELMAGNSNCRWYWGTPKGTREPTIPWCGLLWADGTPVSLAEAEAVRAYVTGEKKALFFDDFQRAGNAAGNANAAAKTPPALPPAPPRAGYTFFDAGDTPAAPPAVCALNANAKLIAGDETWTDYIVETVVMLPSEKGNAGVVFRASNYAAGTDNLSGYYVGFTTKTLYLGKFDNSKKHAPVWKQLASFDLAKLDCKTTPGVWNQIRVKAKGNNIKVWFNRMHESADTTAGLRIDYTDTDAPFLRGAAGLRTHQTPAQFDNFIVLPAEYWE